MGRPRMAASVSVVGAPSESMAHPAGIVGSSFIRALKMRLLATVVVAISSSQGPGTDMQIGFVPSRGSLACQGATIGDELHMTMPIIPAAEICWPQYAAAPKWLDSRAETIAMPCLWARRTACAQQTLAICWPDPLAPLYSRHDPDSDATRPSAAGCISPRST